MLKYPNLYPTYGGSGYDGNYNLGNEGFGKLFTGNSASTLTQTVIILPPYIAPTRGGSLAPSDVLAYYNGGNGQYTLSEYPTWTVKNEWRVDRSTFDFERLEYIPYDAVTNPHGPTYVPFASYSGPGVTSGPWTIDFAESYAEVAGAITSYYTVADEVGRGVFGTQLIMSPQDQIVRRTTLSFTGPIDLPWGQYRISYTRTYRVQVGYSHSDFYGGPIFVEVAFTVGANFLKRLVGPVSSSVIAPASRAKPIGTPFTVSGSHPHYSMTYPSGGSGFGGFYTSHFDLRVAIADDLEPETYLGPNSWLIAIKNPAATSRELAFSRASGALDTIEAPYSDPASYLAPAALAAYEAGGTNPPSLENAAFVYGSPPLYSTPAGYIPTGYYFHETFFREAFYALRQTYPTAGPYVAEPALPEIPGSYTYYWITQSSYPQSTQVYDHNGFIQGVNRQYPYEPQIYAIVPFDTTGTASDTTDYGFLPPTIIRIDIIVTGIVPAAPTSGGFGSVSNLGHPTANFQRVVADLTGIQFYRSVFGVPGLHALPASVWDEDTVFITTVPPAYISGPPVVTTPRDRSPHLFHDPRGILYCVFERLGDTYITRTTDDGRTWEAETMAIPGGTHPTATSSANGECLIAALKTTGSGGTAAYQIQSQYRGPGDAHFGTVFLLKDQTGAVLAVQNDSVGLAFVQMSSLALILSVLIAGETATSEWVSYDLSATGATFKRIPTS